MKPEFLVAAPFILIGLWSAWRSLKEPMPGEDARARFLIALHEAAKAGFWLALGGFFVLYGLLDEPQSFRWFALVPVAMAGLRLAAAAILARG